MSFDVPSDSMGVDNYSLNKLKSPTETISLLTYRIKVIEILPVMKFHVLAKLHQDKPLISREGTDLNV